MVIVICEAVPDSHCYNYGERWAQPHRRSYGKPCAKRHQNYFLHALTKPLA